MNTQEVIQQFEAHVTGNYNGVRQGIVIVRGKGVHMWDLEGKQYLDMFPGWAVSGLGHCHDRVVQAIKDQAQQLIHIDNTFYNLPQGQLAEMLSKRSFGGKCFFCNSGAEAVEAAIKLGRLAGGQDRYKIITMQGSFHGRTYAAMTATGQAKAHAGMQPLLPGFEYVPFNDIEAVKAAIDEQTAAVMLEPIQGEGGVRIADQEYLRQLRELCDQNQMVLIFDEVQTGMGRTGKWFAYQHYGIEPDIMTLAKSLGGGVSIGAIVAKPDVAEFFKPGTHASTFGGNPLACAAGVAVIQAIEDQNLLENATQMGKYLADKLGELQSNYPVIKQIRHLGLMVAMELEVAGGQLVELALQQGLRINCTQQTVIRLMPPMIVNRDQLDQVLEILEKVLRQFQDNLAASSQEPKQ